VVGSCDQGNVPLCSVKSGEFFDKLDGSHFLKFDSLSWSSLVSNSSLTFEYAYLSHMGGVARKSIHYFKLLFEDLMWELQKSCYN